VFFAEYGKYIPPSLENCTVNSNNKKMSESKEDKVNEAVALRIKELQVQKFSSEKVLLERKSKYGKKFSSSMNDDDKVFFEMLCEGWLTHIKEIEQHKLTNERISRKSKKLEELCRQLQSTNKLLTEQNTKASNLKSQMQTQLQKGIDDVKSKIAFYEETNLEFHEENQRLRTGLRQSYEHSEKKQKLIDLLQKNNVELRKKHEETHNQYQLICDDYLAKLEETQDQNSDLKKKYVLAIEQNQLLQQKIKAEKETKDLVDEFEIKYVKKLEESQTMVKQYKLINDKLQKQNHALAKRANDSKNKQDKFGKENKEFKKKNHKLDKKVSTLSNLCRDLQNRLRSQLQKQKSENEELKNEDNVENEGTEETNV